MSKQPPKTKPSLADLLGDGRYLLQALDAQKAVFVPVTRQVISDSPFLDQRMVLPEQTPRYQVPVRALVMQAPAQSAGPSRYLLHTSHVGSTLVSRALGFANETLSLREPLPIRYLSQVRSQIEDAHFRSESLLSLAAFQALQRHALTLLNRPLGDQRRVLVKTTSWTNNIADTLLLQAAEAPRAVAISAKLNAFVANMLKSAGAKQDLQAGAALRLRRLGRLVPGFEPELWQLGPGELAACAWLVELLSMHHGAAVSGAALCWLDFDEYLKAPAEQTEQLAEHLDLPWQNTCTDALTSSGLFSRYSKVANDKPYDANSRASILSEFQASNADVVTTARRWLDQALATYPGLERRLPGWAI